MPSPLDDQQALAAAQARLREAEIAWLVATTIPL